jgi:response regulator RpfG family c-di-GMP phosphodiesterase
MADATPAEDLLRNLSLLYVEDDDDIRGQMAKFLARRVKKLDVAKDGGEGLAAFQAGHHDVVVTDIKMPGMDGLEMAARIRSDYRDVPIIVITAFSERDYLMRSIELGIDRYVTKPIDPDALVEAIYAGSRGRLQQREFERMRGKMLDILEQTVTALARSIERRDAFTHANQKSVAELAVAIGAEMGLPASVLDGLRLACLIHDIGNVQVPADILCRAGPLQPVERALIEGHSAAGADILADVPFPWPVADMVRQHHERLDGSGYPAGLTDGGILLEARIMAVADVYDAMTSHRPYRPALSHEQAAAELKAGSGSRYDPEVVEACLRVVERLPKDIGGPSTSA